MPVAGRHCLPHHGGDAGRHGSEINMSFLAEHSFSRSYPSAFERPFIYGVELCISRVSRKRRIGERLIASSARCFSWEKP